jgi:hypothetical protein
MATFHFDLVAPDELLFSGEVDQVDVRGSEGDFGVLAGHMPIVTMLRSGPTTVHVDGRIQQFMATGGFATRFAWSDDSYGRILCTLMQVDSISRPCPSKGEDRDHFRQARASIRAEICSG